MGRVGLLEYMSIRRGLIGALALELTGGSGRCGGRGGSEGKGGYRFAEREVVALSSGRVLSDS